MNTRLNKKVKKDLDAYFKGFRGSDPEVHHGLKHILIGALTDANFHSEAKQVQNMFPKAKQSKYYGRRDMEDSIEQNHGEPIAKAAKWDGYEIIDAISFFASMFIGGPVGAKITSLKEGMNENVKMFVSRFIKEVTHSYEYEDMSTMGEDENDNEEVKVGEYQTKYFHMCAHEDGASELYSNIESKGVDMDMAERSVRLQDALFFIQEHVSGEGYTADKDYVMVATNIAKNIMKMAKLMGLEKEHSYIQTHLEDIIKSVEGKKLEERVIELTEKNTPTDPAKWAASKAAAKKKFDVYPSAYANAWAAKNYKGKGGGWRTTKESVNENDSYSITDDKGRPFLLIVGEEPKDSKGKSDYKKDGFYISPQKGFKGLITAYFKDEKTLKKNIDKKYHKQLGESVNEAKSMDTSKRLKVYDKLKKGDEITIKYGSSMSSGREGKFKVTKGKTLVGKQKVERIILQNVSNPKGVKYFLYQRNGNVTMAIGNMAATIEDMYEGINEMDLNDPIMVKLRAAQIKKNKDAAKKIEKQKKINPDYKALKNAPKIKALKNKRAEIMRDMEQEAEPEGGKIADRYGRELNKIDNAIIKLGGNPMSESINEAKEPEVITTLRKIVKNKQNDLIKDTKSGKKVRVDMNSANLMVQVYDALKQSNKDKFVKSGIVMMGHMAYKLMKKENTSEVIEEAEYQGRKVELNKPMQGDSKKFKVYVKNAKGNVVVVHFGQKGMNIKKNNPKARKSFRARMNCDNPGPKWKANYWSCRKW